MDRSRWNEIVEQKKDKKTVGCRYMQCLGSEVSTISVVQTAKAETLPACVARIVVLLITSGRGQGYQFPLL
jgi:hypothetical protein